MSIYKQLPNSIILYGINWFVLILCFWCLIVDHWVSSIFRHLGYCCMWMRWFNKLKFTIFYDYILLGTINLRKFNTIQKKRSWEAESHRKRKSATVFFFFIFLWFSIKRNFIDDFSLPTNHQLIFIASF